MQVMYRFADLIDKHTIDLCAWEAKSMGQPVMITQWMYKIASDYFRYMAGWTDKVPGEQWPEVDGIYKVCWILDFSFSQGYANREIDC